MIHIVIEPIFLSLTFPKEPLQNHLNPFHQDHACATLRGYWYCTSYPKISMFCALPQNHQHLLEKKRIYAPCSKFSKELKNRIKIKVDQAILELLIQTTF